MKLKLKPFIKQIKGINWLVSEIPSQYVPDLEKVLKHDDITVEITKTKKARSLTSNSYCWVLINKMAHKLKSTDNEVYLQMLERYGAKDYVAAPIGSEEILKRAYKVVIPIKECILNDTKAMTFKLIRGSSTYCQVEMNRFIEGIISECKLLQIETLPPEEVRRLINMMEV